MCRIVDYLPTDSDLDHLATEIADKVTSAPFNEHDIYMAVRKKLKKGDSHERSRKS